MTQLEATEDIVEEIAEEPTPLASSRERTLVIVLAQVAVIVGLLVLWSVLRARRARRCEG